MEQKATSYICPTMQNSFPDLVRKTIVLILSNIMSKSAIWHEF